MSQTDNARAQSPRKTQGAFLRKNPNAATADSTQNLTAFVNTCISFILSCKIKKEGPLHWFKILSRTALQRSLFVPYPYGNSSLSPSISGGGSIGAGISCGSVVLWLDLEKGRNPHWETTTFKAWSLDPSRRVNAGKSPSPLI